MPEQTRAAEQFEGQRSRLLGLAYRMLGSRAEAEDAVQESWLRWNAADRGDVRSPAAFLTRVVTRLCLDRLKSAQAAREVYVGPWLPEPILDQDALIHPGPESESEFASTLTFAFMLALERLSPLERAAFLMHDVFGADFDEVARALGRSSAACRQLASRARANVRREAASRTFRLPPEHSQRLTTAFLLAVSTGDDERLKKLLAADAVFLSDGGGKVAAAGVPVTGSERVAKALIGLTRKSPMPPNSTVQFSTINGEPGIVVREANGIPVQTLALRFDERGLIRGIYVVRNPEKLRHLAVAV